MREFLKSRLSSAVLALALVSMPQSFAAKQQVYTLPLPPAAAAGSDVALVARVSVGPLKPHERIILRTANGEIAGTISPFGAQARRSGSIYTIPIPASAPKNGQVRLLLEVVRENASTRAPTSEEVRSITLAYIAVTKSGNKE
jgi:hypothetical protein